MSRPVPAKILKITWKADYQEQLDRGIGIVIPLLVHNKWFAGGNTNINLIIDPPQKETPDGKHHD